MNCPQCWQPWVCGCGACKDRNRGQPKFRFMPDGNSETCPSCGFTASVDFWFSEQFFQLPQGHEMLHTRVSAHQAYHIRHRPMMNAERRREGG